MVTFTIPGPVTSANRVTRRVGNKSLKSAGARTDHARIRSLAIEQRARWGLRDPASVIIIAWNSRLDIDNLPKVILDGLKGVLIVDDSPKHLKRLLVEHWRDAGGERYEVVVKALDYEQAQA